MTAHAALTVAARPLDYPMSTVWEAMTVMQNRVQTAPNSNSYKDALLRLRGALGRPHAPC